MNEYKQSTMLLFRASLLMKGFLGSVSKIKLRFHLILRPSKLWFSIANIYNMYTVRKSYLAWSCSLPSCNNLTKEKQVKLDVPGCCSQTLDFEQSGWWGGTRASARSEKSERKECSWLSNNHISGAWLALLRNIVVKLDYTTLMKVGWAKKYLFVKSY